MHVFLLNLRNKTSSLLGDDADIVLTRTNLPKRCDWCFSVQWSIIRQEILHIALLNCFLKIVPVLCVGNYSSFLKRTTCLLSSLNRMLDVPPNRSLANHRVVVPFQTLISVPHIENLGLTSPQHLIRIRQRFWEIQAPERIVVSIIEMMI